MNISFTVDDYWQFAARAVALSRAGDYAQAGQEFRRLAHMRPQDPRLRQAMLECALDLVRRGEESAWPTDDTTQRMEGLISFIVCSITPTKLARLVSDLRALFDIDEFELVHIDDARSLTEGYSRGLKRARGNLLVFCHDDIRLMRKDFAARLRNHFKQHEVFGVAGATRTNGPTWPWAGPPHTHCWVMSPGEDDKVISSLLGVEGDVIQNAKLLDGVFIATHRYVAERIGFDSDTFRGFHFYDIDFSYRAALAGLNCAITCDLLLLHESGGAFDSPEFKRDADLCIKKFPALRPTGPCADFGAAGVPMLRSEAEKVYQWIARWMSVRLRPGS